MNIICVYSEAFINFVILLFSYLFRIFIIYSFKNHNIKKRFQQTQ